MKMHEYIEQGYQANIAKRIGYAVEILGYTSNRSLVIEDCLKRVMPAIRLNQIEFLYDGLGRPIGYISWAHLTDEVIEALHNFDYQLDLSDWNEGDRLWIVDFLAPLGGAAQLARKVRLRHFTDGKQVAGRRLDNRVQRYRLKKVNVRRVERNIGG